MPRLFKNVLGRLNTSQEELPLLLLLVLLLLQLDICFIGHLSGSIPALSTNRY